MNKTMGIILSLIVLGAILAFSLSRQNETAPDQQASQAQVDSNQTPGPYRTVGGNEQENDNFYIPGRVESLDTVRDKNKATIVWIAAPWCTICHAIRPFIAPTANKYADKVALVEIDFDSNPHIVTELGLFGTPQFIVLDKSGKEVGRFGPVTKETWETELIKASQIN